MTILEPYGYHRLKEALICNDWDATGYPDEYASADNYLAGGSELSDEDEGDLDGELAEMDTELRGLKEALLSGAGRSDDPDRPWPDPDDPQGLENFEKMMGEVLAIKGEAH